MRRGVVRKHFFHELSRDATREHGAARGEERRRHAVDPRARRCQRESSHRRGRPGAQKREQVILPPLNEKIIQPLLRVVVDRGEADDEVLGIITRDEALERAREEGVDLVMIAEKSDPPVCKIVDYGKLRYQKDKKKKEQAKKAKTNEIKEVKTCVEINQCVGCTSRRRRGRPGSVKQ